MEITLSSAFPKTARVARVVFHSEKEPRVRVQANKHILIEIGVGKAAEMTRRKIVLIIRQMVSVAKANGVAHIAVALKEFAFAKPHVSEEELLALLSTNLLMANFEFVKYKTLPKKGWRFVKTATIVASASAAQKAALRKGVAIGEAVNACRALANTPGGEMTPRLLAEEATKAARGTKVSVKILEEPEIKRLKMGGVLGVAQGSAEKPRFIIMEYRGGKTGEKPIVLVGKGITFDTGGLNLKPEGSISEMHMDMSGGAAVIQTIVLAARLGTEKNIVALVPAVENMPSGSSYRPGDVLKSMSGKTIEVLNTDAEGRIVLADALTYAERYKPRLVVDVATLTGAAMTALGQRASAVFSKDEELLRKVQQWGEETGEYVWPLPLWDEYAEEIKGTFGDIANIGKTRYGGAITAALFLYEFAKNYPWVHIDIAPRMTSIEGEHLAKGAAGAPVRLLVRLLEEF